MLCLATFNVHIHVYFGHQTHQRNFKSLFHIAENCLILHITQLLDNMQAFSINEFKQMQCLLKVIHWLIVDMQKYEKLHLNSKYGEFIAIGSSFILCIYYIYFTKKRYPKAHHLWYF